MTPEFTTADKPFAEVTEADIKVAPFQMLRRWSIAAGLGGAGNAEQIRRRLVAKVSGTVGTHTHGKTQCCICPALAKVTGNKRYPQKDGRTLLVRQMKCAGKHGHTFTLKCFEGVKKPGF